jgi:hypothetical protein
VVKVWTRQRVVQRVETVPIPTARALAGGPHAGGAGDAGGASGAGDADGAGGTTGAGTGAGAGKQTLALALSFTDGTRRRCHPGRSSFYDGARNNILGMIGFVKEGRKSKDAFEVTSRGTPLPALLPCAPPSCAPRLVRIAVLSPQERLDNEKKLMEEVARRKAQKKAQQDAQ